MTAKKQISLCMVTYNDEKHISDCLCDLREYVDETIVADIGSTDQTVELAKRTGAEVYRFDWNDSFSDARNFCMDRSGGRWVLFLQADESISAEHLKNLAAFIKNPNQEGYLFYYDNNINAQGVSSPNSRLRLIRNRKEYRYLCRAYERLPDEQITSIQNADIKIERRGDEPSWDGAMRIRLLDMDIAECPGDHYINYIYGLRLFNEGKHEESIDYFQKACDGLNTDYIFAPHLYKCLSWSLLYLKRYPEALEILNSGIECFPLYTDLLVLRGEVYHKLAMYKESIQDLKLCLNSMKQAASIVPRPETNAAIVWEMLGIILEHLVNFPQALLCFQEAYRMNYRNTELFSEICRLAVEEDLPEVLTDMLNIPLEQKMPDQIMILAKAFFTLGEYQKALDCISLLKCIGLPDRLLEMEYTCRMILGKDENDADADGTINNRFLPQRIQCLWLRDQMEEADSLLQEMDTSRGIAPALKTLYRRIQSVFSGQVRQSGILLPDEYEEISSLHTTLLRNGQAAKAEAVLPLLLGAQNEDHLIGLGLSWTRHNDFHILRRIYATISDADKKAEYIRRVIRKLLHDRHVETAEKLLQLDPDQPSEEITLAIWSAHQTRKMEDMICHMRSIGIINNVPERLQEQQIPDKSLLSLFRTVHEDMGIKSDNELTCAEIHKQFGTFFEKNQKKTEALSAYLRVLQWDPLNEAATQKINACFGEDPCLSDGLLQNMPWPMEGGLFSGKEAFINYIRGLVSFRGGRYEQALTFLSEATETGCTTLAYLILILCLSDREAEAKILLRDSGHSSELPVSFCVIYREYILHKLDEALARYAYSGLLLGQKENVQNWMMAFTA